MKKTLYFNDENINDIAIKLKTKLLEFGLRPYKHFNSERVALIVLDMQNYFLLETSHAFVPSAKAITKYINLLIDSFTNNNLPIIFTKHSNNEENANQMSWRWRNLIPERGTFYNIYEKLITKNNLIIEKHQYDAFYETELFKILKTLKIEQVVIAGVLTNLCVETTARSAFVRGFNTIVPIDATATYNFELHLSSMMNIAFAINFPPLTNELLTHLGGS